MNENGFNLEDNDFGSLADIFPDIEPYLEDVTNSFETARNEIDKKKIEIHVDGSDSDSGISADNYANGIVKSLDSSLSSSILSNEVLKSIKVASALSPENNCVSKTNKILIKRPISFISKVGSEIRQPIYNISSKFSDINYQKAKPIFLKSQTSFHKTMEINKKTTKPLSKITPIKLLKNNEGFPVIINEVDINRCDTYSFYDSGNRQVRKVDGFNDPSLQNENDSYNLLSNSTKSETLFLKNEIFSNMSYKTKGDSCADLEMSIDEFKSEDCQSYFDLFNPDQNSKNKVLQTSSVYNNLGNTESGMLDQQHYDRMLKKQERMIKNRQAASLSRQRKKEYVERLEHKLEQLKQENHYKQNQVNDIRERFCALEQENQLLKKDIQTWRERYYDLERQKFKQGIITTTFKLNDKNLEINKIKALKATAASTTILGIFIILTFNFNSLNSNISSFYKSQTEDGIDPIFKRYPAATGGGGGDDIIQNYFFAKKKLFDSGSDTINHRLGRTLFSVSDNTTSVSDNEDLNHICNNITGMNVSETLRLTRELHRWGSRFKAESVKIYDRLQNEKIKSKILSKEIQSIYTKSRKDIDNPMEATTSGKIKKKFISGQLEIYPKNNDYGFFDNFIDEIDRKPDTLYFVTFHSDNLIFPASNMMKNLSTPKITLVLPADINQKDKNYYKMMKIDCQVQNFTIVNLKKLRVP